MKALLDSNTLIYLSQLKLRWVFLEDFETVHHSIITHIELLSFNMPVVEEILMQQILRQSSMLPLTHEIATQSIEFRRQRRISLPDAVIAATAWVHGLVLITADQGSIYGTGTFRVYPRPWPGADYGNQGGFPALLPPNMLYNPLGPRA